ncbi:MAG: hypothetical protein OQL16_14385 [Gammaproteobacteria bacterium]|nr:hypothetical protein [Gammaproteobacteria bacterium]
MSGSFFQQLCLAFICYVIAMNAYGADNPPPAGIFENSACIECHQKTSPKLISDWRTSSHASSEPLADCIACHGKLHESTAVTARRDSACIECHGGNKSPVVHSYTTSKHGVLMQLERKSYDWKQPLSGAKYRSPGCSYCHMRGADHNVNNMVRSDLMNVNAVNDVEIETRKVCQDCHAPRYIISLLVSGEDMLEIARKKVREANTLVTQATEDFSNDELEPARKIILTMQKHLKNVYLGAGHQSPDYQWWHGQPALDGDLLRIKGIVGELHRKKSSAIH